MRQLCWAMMVVPVVYSSAAGSQSPTHRLVTIHNLLPQAWMLQRVVTAHYETSADRSTTALQGSRRESAPLCEASCCAFCPGWMACSAGYEPTSMRAIRARYNPYVQARARVDQLRKLGHSADKVSSGGHGVGYPGAAQGLRENAAV